jgi:hypothetical protein
MRSYYMLRPIRTEDSSLQPDQLTTTSATAPKARSATDHAVPAWRRALLAWPLLLLGIHGCTDLSKSSISAVKLAVHHAPRVEPTATEVAAKPYFQLEATSPDGSAVLILGNVDGHREAWYGAHQVVVFIEHGRIVQTVGLSQNLDGLRLPADDPFAHGLQTLATPVNYSFDKDWSPGYRYGVQVDARLIPAGREQISILGTTHQVLRVDEQINVPIAHLRATNHYWVDPQDGFVWKSEQQVAPGLTLQLVQLRPYREQQR